MPTATIQWFSRGKLRIRAAYLLGQCGKILIVGLCTGLNGFGDLRVFNLVPLDKWPSGHALQRLTNNQYYDTPSALVATYKGLDLNILIIVLEDICHDTEASQAHDLPQCSEILRQLRMHVNSCDEVLTMRRTHFYAHKQFDQDLLALRLTHSRYNLRDLLKDDRLELGLERGVLRSARPSTRRLVPENAQ